MQEVESMMKSVHSARAVALLQLIGLIQLVLPMPEMDDLCLPSSNSIGGGDNTSGSSSDSGSKTKKKKNNEVETIIANTPKELVIIKQNSDDFHSYGCSAVMVLSLLEQASKKGSGNISPLATSSDTVLMNEEITHSTTIVKSLDIDQDIITQISQMMNKDTLYLLNFLKDLGTYQSEETAKVLR